MRNESITVKGEVRIELRDCNGNLKQSHTNHNLVVTIGKTYLAAWLAAASQAGPFMSFIALGTNGTAPSAGQTALIAESVVGGYARVAGTITSASNVWQNKAVFGPTVGTDTIQEVGLFSAITSGTMFARQAGFAPIIKLAADTLTVTWSVTFS